MEVLYPTMIAIPGSPGAGPLPTPPLSFVHGHNHRVSPTTRTRTESLLLVTLEPSQASAVGLGAVTISTPTAHAPQQSVQKDAPSLPPSPTQTLYRRRISVSHSRIDLRSSPVDDGDSGSRGLVAIKRPRPGTAAVLKAPLSPPLTSVKTLKRPSSLDESQLPSFRARNDIEPRHVPFPIFLVNRQLSSRPPSEESQSDDALGCSSASSTEESTTRSQANLEKCWHVLMELLVTEQGYVTDLRNLVLVYLSQLTRYLQVSRTELEAISRNAQQLLLLHERIGDEFSQIESTLLANQESYLDGIHNASGIALSDMIDQMAKVLLSKATDFSVYSHYCSHHMEALEVVRRLQERPEWDVYEQQCTVLSLGAVIFEPKLHRRHSTDALTLLSGSANTALPAPSRLRLMDLLIKPIQRICKYPLMLSELQGTAQKFLRPLTSDFAGPSLLEKALEAMKAAAATVDDAKGARELAIKSRLIVSRMEAHTNVTPSFLESLGPCLLVGTLEVVYYHDSSLPLKVPVKSRHCGSFLYRDYILFVKIKKGKVYEARHWLPLHLAQLSDLADEQSLLPVSFRITNGSHHLELAACSSAEKQIWMKALTEARANALTRVPEQNTTAVFSSFPESPPATKRDLVSLNDVHAPRDGSRAITPPTIPPSSAYPGSTLSRRSSIFSTDPSSSILRRPSSSHRMHTEKALADVLSESCLSARARAAPFPDAPSQRSDLVLGGRSKSWGKATGGMLARTSSVSARFYRRSVMEPTMTTIPGSPALSQDPRSADASSHSAGRPLPFPPSSPGYRQRQATSSLALPTGFTPSVELDEEVGTPESTNFPLTPDHDAFSDHGLPLTTQDAIEDPIGSSPSRRRSLTLLSNGFSKHVRTRSGELAQNVRDVLFRKREAGPPVPVIVPNGLLGAQRGDISTSSLIQKGLSMVMRKRATSEPEGGAASPPVVEVEVAARSIASPFPQELGEPARGHSMDMPRRVLKKRQRVLSNPSHVLVSQTS